MRALTVVPGQAQSGSLPNPELQPERVQVRTLAVGICGTDREILAGKYGTAAPGRERLVLGHELLGEVQAGPIGLPARQRGYELYVYDRDHGETKRRLVADLDGEYHSGAIGQACAAGPDVIVECTGAAEVIMAVLGRNGRGGIVCLAGPSSGEHRVRYDLGGLNRSMVLENDVVFGTVNANRRHYEQAAIALARADQGWLRRLISRRVPLSRWQQAVERQPGDVKVVIDLATE